MNDRVPGQMYGKDMWQREHWWTMDGRLLRIEDMASPHLNNTIRLLYRKGKSLKFQFMCMTAVAPVDYDSMGDMAALSVQQDEERIERALADGDVSVLPIVQAMVSELTKRGDTVAIGIPPIRPT